MECDIIGANRRNMGLTTADIEKIRETIVSVFKQEILKDLERSIEIRVHECVTQEVTEINSTIQRLVKNMDELKERNNSLEAMLDRHEQSSRGLNIRIFGVQQTENEDLQKVILDMFNKVKCVIKPGEIKKCHRIAAKNGEGERQRVTRSNSGGANSNNTIENRPPAVLVRFDTDKPRTIVLKKRKQLLETMGVRIREDLTKYRLSLLAKAVEKFTSKNAWCLHGNVYVKLGETVHRVADFDTLEKLSTKTIRKQR